MNIFSWPMYWVDQWGGRILSFFTYTLRVFEMFYLSFRSALFYSAQSLRTIMSVVSAQVYFTGFQALPLIGGLALATSSLVLVQSATQLSLLGGGSMMGQLLVVVVIRELAPLLTALIVIARSGTAVASEIGNMRVNREIEALEVMGISPLGFIIFPRLLGGIISVICLALFFVYVSVAGGFLFAKIFMSMPLDFYIDSVVQVLEFGDIGLLLTKNIFSGAIIFSVCCYQGMQVKSGPHEVPQATTSAVVNSIIYVVGFNIIVTLLFYLNQLMRLGII